MRKAACTFLLVVFAGVFTFAQEKTTEKKITTNSKGEVDSTKSVIISTTEDITPRNNIIAINPLKFLLFYNINYYRKINNTVVIGGGFQIPTLSEVNGLGINGEVRIHPTGKALRGFYFAPNFSFNSLNSSWDKDETTATSIGLLIGWQWFPSDEFAMGLGIGIDHYFSSNKRNSFSDYDGNSPALRFDVGFAW